MQRQRWILMSRRKRNAPLTTVPEFLNFGLLHAVRGFTLSCFSIVSQSTEKSRIARRANYSAVTEMLAHSGKLSEQFCHAPLHTFRFPDRLILFRLVIMYSVSFCRQGCVLRQFSVLWRGMVFSRRTTNRVE